MKRPRPAARSIAVARAAAAAAVVAVAVALAFAAAVWLAPAAAVACPNGYLLNRNKAALLLASAEEDLGANRPARARATLSRMAVAMALGFRDPDRAVAVWGPAFEPTFEAGILQFVLDHGQMRDQKVAPRWLFLFAVASARTRATMRFDPEATLARLAAADPENPALQSRLAEVRSALPDKSAAALATLDDLDARDLIPDAEGYAALARLRAARGDTAGGERARARCRTLARDASVCDAPGGRARP